MDHGEALLETTGSHDGMHLRSTICQTAPLIPSGLGLQASSQSHQCCGYHPPGGPVNIGLVAEGERSVLWGPVYPAPSLDAAGDRCLQYLLGSPPGRPTDARYVVQGGEDVTYQYQRAEGGLSGLPGIPPSSEGQLCFCSDEQHSSDVLYQPTG